MVFCSLPHRKGLLRAGGRQKGCRRSATSLMQPLEFEEKSGPQMVPKACPSSSELLTSGWIRDGHPRAPNFRATLEHEWSRGVFSGPEKLGPVCSATALGSDFLSRVPGTGHFASAVSNPRTNFQRPFGRGRAWPAPGSAPLSRAPLYRASPPRSPPFPSAHLGLLHPLCPSRSPPAPRSCAPFQVPDPHFLRALSPFSKFPRPTSPLPPVPLPLGPTLHDSSPDPLSSRRLTPIFPSGDPTSRDPLDFEAPSLPRRHPRPSPSSRPQQAESLELTSLRLPGLRL